MYLPFCRLRTVIRYFTDRLAFIFDMNGSDSARDLNPLINTF
jgi:hypothetical protein